jgi:uncharacterized protein GlcG (DUF336 family)
MMKAVIVSALALFASSAALAQPTTSGDTAPQGCSIPGGVVNRVLRTLGTVVNASDGNGGLFQPNEMWAAVVDRNGTLCGVTRNSPDAWPGSRSIAIAKATTANGFSNSKLAFSTANLYAPTQPGGSLYGLNFSNPQNPTYLPFGTGVGQVVGGIITFGGGVALYGPGGNILGGLGVSGDTSCADHTIAYRMRHLAGYDAIPRGPNSSGTDNIEYAAPGTPPTGFQQPHCLPTDIPPEQILSGFSPGSSAQ